MTTNDWLTILIASLATAAGFGLIHGIAPFATGWHGLRLPIGIWLIAAGVACVL